MARSKARRTPESSRSLGFFCLIVVLFESLVKPLANIVADYTRSDRNKKGYGILQAITSLCRQNGMISRTSRRLLRAREQKE